MTENVGPIVLRRASTGDTGAISRWLVAPHVARWSYRVLSTISGKLEAVVQDPAEHLLIAELDGRPVGCVYLYKAAGDARWADVVDVSPQTRAVEFLIGETNVVNKKVGQKMLRVMIEQTFRDPDVDRIVAAPHPDNWAAIIAMKRAGFREKGRHPDAKVNAMNLTVTPATFKA